MLCFVRRASSHENDCRAEREYSTEQESIQTPKLSLVIIEGSQCRILTGIPAVRSVNLSGRFWKMEVATIVNNVAVTVVSWARHAKRKLAVVVLEIATDWNLVVTGNVIFPPLHSAACGVAVFGGGMERG